MRGVSVVSDPVCSIDGCPKRIKARGWCSKHYDRWLKNGDPYDYGSFVMGDVVARFQSKVDEADGCWLWTSKRTAGGYGQLWDGEKYVMAHRWSYEHHAGPIPEGLTLDHLCHGWDTSCLGGVSCLHRRCVNPDHLEPVSLYVNVMRGNTPARRNADKSVCSYGHPFDGENTYIEQGHRQCRTCRSRRNRAKYLRRKARQELVNG